MSVTARRIARLARTGSPAAVVRAVRRELALRRDEASLAEGLAGRGRVVAGPFVGEVGYELLYWRPFVLRTLRERAVDPERVTVVGRGGSAGWYGEFARGALDVFDIVDPGEVRRAAELRPFSSPKQLAVDELDQRILARAGLRDATLLHPRFMYWRFRYVWEGVEEVAAAPALGHYDPLPRTRLPTAIERRLPPEFVAVKAYFNDCIPDEPPCREAFAEVVSALSDILPVVLLATTVAADTHSDWSGASRAIALVDLLDPAANLAQQVEIVARARALVSTYGGFSYAGPFVGVPTVAVSVRPEDNRQHEGVLRAALPQARFTRLPLDAGAVAGEVGRW